MGKAHRNKNRRSGPAPTGLKTVKDAEREAEEENISGLSNAVLNLMEKLQGPSPDERECTCATISNLLPQPGAIQQFLRAGFVRIAGPLLIDPSLGVRRAALGALRNLTVDGGLQTCTKMVEQDVMTPLVALLQKFGTEWGADKHHVVETEVYHQALHLLWNLCESNSTAVKIFNQQNLLPLLLPSLFPSNHGYSVAITTAQCLYTVTEDNPDMCQVLGKPESVQEIQKVLMDPGEEGSEVGRSEVLLHRVLLAGILYNVSGGELSRLGAGLVGHVIDLLVTVLDQDVNEALCQLSQFLEKLENTPDDLADIPSSSAMDLSSDLTPEPTDEGTHEQGEETLEGSMEKIEENLPGASTDSKKEKAKEAKRKKDDLEIKHKELDKLISQTQSLINAQQVAIETTANLCCGQDDEDWEDTDESEASSDDITGDAQTDNMEDQGPYTEMESLCLPEELQRAFVQSGLIHKIFQKLKPVAKDLLKVIESNNQSKIVKKSYDSLHLRALLCTSNLVSALTPDDIGGCDVLRELWAMLSQLITAAMATENGESLEGATSALRAVVDKLDEVDDQQFQLVSGEDLEFLCRLGTECSHPQVRANATRIIATLGGQQVHHGDLQHLKGIGEFLYRVASTDSELWVIAEALDAMFDVFGDDKTDPVVKELSLISNLKQLLPSLKQKVQQQKRQLGEHYAIVTTAKTNLVRFIKYKSNRPSANS